MDTKEYENKSKYDNWLAKFYDVKGYIEYLMEKEKTKNMTVKAKQEEQK